MYCGRLAGNVQNAVGIYNSQVAMSRQRIQMALRKPVSGRS
jgi:hypothetical protein